MPTATLTRTHAHPAPSAPQRIGGIYARISKDRGELRIGVERQVRECLALAERENIHVPEWAIFIDTNRSAFKGKPRKEYERLLQTLHELDVIIPWASDRLTRHPRELEDLIDVLNASGTAVRTVSGGDYDLSTTEGRQVARILGSIARGESERISARVKSKQTENRDAGKPHGGFRPYGYKKDGLTIVPAEAEVIREMAARILAGESSRGIVADLNARGIPTANERRWSASRIPDHLRKPRIAGLVALPDGGYVKAQWEPIIDQTTWTRLVAIFGDGKSEIGKRGRNIKLLTGLLRCGRCGSMMQGNTRMGGIAIYSCRNADGKPGCGKLSIKAEPVDDLVIKATLARLSDDLGKHAPDDSHEDEDADVRELERIQREIADLADEHARGDIDKATYRRDVAAFERVAEEVKARLAARVRDDAPLGLIQGITGVDAKAWDQYNRDQQRTMLAHFIDHIVIKPFESNVKGEVDTERVEIFWTI